MGFGEALQILRESADSEFVALLVYNEVSWNVARFRRGRIRRMVHCPELFRSM